MSEQDNDLDRLRAAAREADKGGGVSLSGLSRDERRSAMTEQQTADEKLAYAAAWAAWPNADDHPERIAFRNGYIAAIAAARPMIAAEERERCAKVAEVKASMAKRNGMYPAFCLNAVAETSEEIAAAIRAMGVETHD